jgi:hypothetical protein
MADSTNLKVNELDFDKIKTNLRDYLKAQDQFRDYNFSGSGISVLLDILAYNTYYNSFYLNMVAAESFLATAQKRNSIINHARSLNYTPRSRISSLVEGSFTITPIGTPTSISIPQYTRFTGTIDGVTYYFNTLTSATVTPSAGTYTLSNVTLKEGLYYNYRYIVNIVDKEQRFMIPNSGVDTTTLVVKVINSSTDSTTRSFTSATNLVEIDATSQIFFLEEVEDGRFELFFGDGIHGVALQDGNIVSLEYLVSSGETANDIQQLTYASSIPNVSTIDFTSTSPSQGGQEREDINRIRFNSTRSYEAQNRAVTVDDFKALLLKQPNVGQVSIWGGEDNVPPTYGRVFIAIKPVSGEVLTATEKTNLIEYVIKPKKILTTTIEMVDPEYIYLLIDVNVKFDSGKTTLTSSSLQSAVLNVITNYNTNELTDFAKYFRYSRLSRLIDVAERSILNSTMTVRLRKELDVQLNQSSKYEIPFSNAIDNTSFGRPETHPYNVGNKLSSNEFTYNGYPACFLEENNGLIRIYRQSGIQTVGVVSNIGTLNYDTGLVVLNGFAPQAFADGGTTLKLTAYPRDLDVLPLRNQIVNIRNNDISVTLTDDNTISLTKR